MASSDSREPMMTLVRGPVCSIFWVKKKGWPEENFCKKIANVLELNSWTDMTGREQDGTYFS